MSTSPVPASETSAPAFDVHLYAVLRIKIPNVPASTPADAIEVARCSPVFDEHVASCAAAGAVFIQEFSHFVTDVSGDEEYLHTRCFYSRETPLWDLARRLVLWIEGDRDPAELQRLLEIAQDAVDLSV